MKGMSGPFSSPSGVSPWVWTTGSTQHDHLMVASQEHDPGFAETIDGTYHDGNHDYNR